MPSRFIVGCGYLGSRVADRWLSAGDTVFALTRSTQRAEQFERRGIRPIVGDISQPERWPTFPTVETVLYALGYDRRSGVSRRDIHVIGFQRLLDRLPALVGKLIFISTTAVYGQTSGDWVDETSPCNPAGESGRVYLEAETMLLAHPQGRQAVILRLAGIYGPGRVPRAARIDTSDESASAGYLNLIHVDDALQAVLAAEQRAAPPRTYCVVDNHPVLRNEYYAEVARLLPPPATDSNAAEVPRSVAAREWTNKRVSNQRMLDELDIVLQYPDYRQGLRAVAGNSGEWRVAGGG